MIDQPDHPIMQDIEAAARIAKLPEDQRAAAREKYRAGTPHSQTRIVLARSDDHSVALRLKDEGGRDRVVIRVAPDGTPAMQFLDANGKVTRELSGASQ